MAREEKTILTNMCMVYDDQGNVLVEDMDEMIEIFESDELTEFYFYYNEDGSWGHRVL